VAAAVLMAAALAIGGCGDDGDQKAPIRLGLLAPENGRAAAVGRSFERVARTAVATINEAGGVGGHELVLVVEDTNSDPATARAKMQELIDGGVVAVVGPALSDNVIEIIDLAAASQTPVISPSSTAVSVLEVEDDGFLFRNTPNDSFQGAAQAHYLARVVDGDKPRIETAAILHESTGYGAGLAASFAAAFEAACDTCDVPDSHVLAYDGGLSNAEANQIIADLGALDPPVEWVMVVTIDVDGVKLMNAWDPSNGDPILPDVKWLLADGARVAAFIDGVPVSMENMLGTAPTNPTTGEAFGVLEAAYEARNIDEVDQQVFAANVWDAYYLLAAALAKQMHDGDELGGASLREAITRVSRGPGQIFHAGQWVDMENALLSGSEVDYDGASGPNDFLSDGETLGPYEVWKITAKTAGPGFEFTQQRFLATSEFDDLVQ
jgi:branched-chain amino acid transport system substrate-binding protein